MIDVREYLDAVGRNQYRAWFDELDGAAAVKVAAVLERIAAGHKSSIEPVGEGVSEYKIDWGPGYRIYFGKDGDQLVILLGGGTKQRQTHDIENAKVLWREYRLRKKLTQKQAEPKKKSKLKTKGK